MLRPRAVVGLLFGVLTGSCVVACGGEESRKAPGDVAGVPPAVVAAGVEARFERDHAVIAGVAVQTVGDARAPRLDGDRVVYERRGVDEWFVSTPRGVEQGFTVRERPAGDVAVQVDLGVDGASVRVLPGALAFGDVTYGELRAWDAHHHELSASMAWDAAARRVTLSIPEAALAGATFPVTIDPLFAAAAWTTDPTDDGDAQYGWAVAGAGDVNGDGYGDVIVGAPGWDGDANNEGKAYLFYGGATGLSTLVGWSADPTDTASAAFGFAVAGAGDVNADGFDDFVVGARGMSAEAAGEGRIYVYLGSATGPGAPITLDLTDQANAHFGAAVAGAGDVNADGYADLIVGAPDWDGASTVNEGRVYVIRGTPSGVEATAVWDNAPTGEDGARYGFSVASAGDVNGDGRSDVVVGAPYWGGNDEGRAYEYDSGPGGPTGSAATWTADPTDQLAANFGWSVAGGDYDGDGHSDVLVGAPAWDTQPTYTDEGRVYVYRATTGALPAAASATLDPTDQSDAFYGQALAALGDVNGDGYADFAAGAPRWDGGATEVGRTYLILGQAGTAQPTWNANPATNTTAYFGAAVGGGVDVDGDGFADLVVGAYQANGTTSTEGRAYLYRGYSGGLATNFNFHGTAGSTSNLGKSVDWAGDVNGDGWNDLLVGENGKVHLYYGNGAGVSTSGEWSLAIASINFGYAVAGIGDVNDDGYADFAVGAPGESSGQGRVRFFRGSAAGPVASGTYWDNLTYNGFGNLVSGGDFNGDGYADLAVAGGGRMSVFAGGPSGLAASPSFATLVIGSGTLLMGLAGVGDVNGDGLDDIVVGRPDWDTGAAPTQTGRADLYLGVRDLTTMAASWSVAPTGVYGHFGGAIAGAGDVNRDGYGDVVVGAPDWYNGSAAVGRAYVYHGTSTGLALTAARVLDGVAPEAFGGGVAGLGDVNGDGFDDIAVGDPDQGASANGRVAAFFGSATGIPATEGWSATGVVSGGRFGSAMAGGDGSGDGFGDLVVGSWLADYGIFAYCCKEGRFDVFYGSDAIGLGRRTAQYRSDGVARLATGGRSADGTVILEARATQEPGLGGSMALEFEVKRVGVPFDGKGTVVSPLVTAGQVGRVTVSGLVPGASYHWRARVRAPVGLILGHWTPHGGNTEAETDFRVATSALGKACGSAVECASGFCVDGVCCNGACGGGSTTDCRACSIAAGADTNGVCGTVTDTSVVCRAQNGVCDAAETCDGISLSCPPDGYASNTTVCRAAVAGVCDVAEKCTGSGTACPVDGFAAGGTPCRGAADVCDLPEACSGTSALCPPDAKKASGTSCRVAADVCDAAEVCDGSSVACPPDLKKASGTPCRVAADVCDLPEACDGSAVACPPDAKKASGTPCRGAADVCDVAEACDGSAVACPPDAKKASGTPCRVAADVCDVAEACDGSAVACPPDAKKASGTPCRVAADVCDQAEACDGSAVACPPDAKKASGTPCRVAADVCDVAEACDGSAVACPPDAKKASGTPCRAAADVCDVAEACDGSAVACPPDAKKASGTPCRVAADVCDVAEACDGSAVACPPDAKKASGTPCRVAADVCDVAEACDGSAVACPPDAKATAGTVCRIAAGVCDAPEACDGSAVACPPDGFLSSSTPCRSGTCSGGYATAPGSCSGSSATCPAAPAPASCGEYQCGPTACLTTCVADSDCVAGDFCDAGACTAKRGLGAACTSSGECTSAHCVDGVCCGSTCGGQCEACDVQGSLGTCSAVTGAPHGQRTACDTDGTVCGGACDGSSRTACAYPGGSTECRAPDCSGGTATLDAQCDGAGACPGLQTQTCPFGCLGTACSGGCPGVPCTSGEYCSAGVCVPRRDPGAACGSDAQCKSSNCVDGVCCDTACTGQCEACDVPGYEGACSPVTGAPTGGRPACTGTGTCAGSCDGTDPAACSYPGATAVCGAGSCTNGVQTDPALCDGAGACGVPGQTPCGSFGCGATACLTTCSADQDCAPGLVCLASTCTTPPPDAGTPDAGTPDAGADAATPMDASAPEASAPDAATFDATAPDAAATGSVDAAAGDGALVDAASDGPTPDAASGGNGGTSAGGSGGRGGATQVGSGGRPATGGTTAATGGAPPFPTGGTSSASGGSGGSGGKSTAPEDAGPDASGIPGGNSGDQGGCGCHVASRHTPPWTLEAVIGVVIALARRRLGRVGRRGRDA